jgi:hypothetical protein
MTTPHVDEQVRPARTQSYADQLLGAGLIALGVG